MDQREQQHQSLGICNKLYNFIRNSLVRHALRRVTLGQPMPNSLAEALISDAAQNENKVSSKSDQIVHPMAEEQANTSKNSDPFAPLWSSSNEQEKDSKEPPQVQGIGDEKNDLCANPGKRLEEEASLPSNELQAKAPKKIVSINERVEEIYTSKKKDKKKKATEKLTSMERKDDDTKPLKSILKVGSNLND